MQYLVICKDKTAFTTDYYTHENCWGENIFCVIDTYSDKISFDGETWKRIAEDHL